ncbi:hypothetical protein R7364_004241 [Klebsiella michiganensis]|nr:hypothetical protein [Klebsiella michiganensis]
MSSMPCLTSRGERGTTEPHHDLFSSFLALWDRGISVYNPHSDVFRERRS